VRHLTLQLRSSERPQSGFTLLELIITISIASLLLAFAIPSFSYVTRSNRMSGQINDLLADMQFARAEAIKEGSDVVVCSSATGTGCSAATTWQTGWIVFSDQNRNGAFDAGERILRVRTALSGSDTLQPQDGTTTAVRFNRDGFAVTLPGGALFKLHDPASTAALTRCLQVTLVGALSTMPAGGGCT
jgi:type IV fimbrial biogenesis protein FimT